MEDVSVSKLTFSNSTSQTSAYTGLTVADSYTNTNMTIGANGKITSIWSGSSGTASIPFARYSIFNSTITNTNYLQINTLGGTSGFWVQNQSFTIRITYSTAWNFTGSGSGNALSNSTTTCLCDIYPYRFSTGWCNHSSAVPYGNMSTNAINGNATFGVVDTTTPPNSADTICPQGRQFWCYGLVNAGTNPTTMPLYAKGNNSNLIFVIVNPSGLTGSAAFNASLTIELVSKGADKATISTSGFSSYTF